jgi:lipoyl-dependent peroxiredoxin
VGSRAGFLAGYVGLAGIPYYAGSKFALEGISEVLAHEVRGFGIKLTAVAPGQPAQSLQQEYIMNRPEKVIYTAKVHTTGGRVGSSRSDDGKLDVKLSRPGTSGAGTNPEQLFAAGWSACYESAMELVARRMKVALPADLAVDAEVDLGPNGAGYDVAVRLNVSLPGIAPDVAQRLIEATHEVCPYSRATHGNIAVETKLM